MARPRGGRIRAHERDTDDTNAILGEGMAMRAEDLAKIRHTEEQNKEKKTKIDMRNRLKHIYTFWQANYPEYYRLGVRPVTDADRQSHGRFYHTNTHDFVYSGLNVQMVKAFLATKTTKENGRTSSHVHIRKYNDAILHGSKEAKEDLPINYYTEMEQFLASFKKETVKAKKDGMLDEHEADPIPYALYRLILQWSLGSKNVLVWVFSILQWNCMARSINIGVLALHNFRVGEDSIICKYDKSKTDQAGERVSDKNIYANPLDPIVCPHLALGIWLYLESSSFEETENLFLRNDTKDTAASGRYCMQVSEIFSQHSETVRTYLREAHAGAHGFRKGSAVLVTSGTTSPPSISSIASRGEWSMGKVLDVYWHFGEPGDHFLGRVVVGLPENSPKFAILPPHFTMTEPILNEDVAEAMDLMYATIVQKHGGTSIDPTGILVRVLPSIIFHSEWLADQARDTPGHPFGTIPLLNNPNLLSRLKLLVTTEPGGQILRATGIPPTVQNAVTLDKMYGLCQDTLKGVENMTEKLGDAVCTAFENNAIENGQMTKQQVANLISQGQEDTKTYVGDRLDTLKSAVTAAMQSLGQPDTGNTADAGDDIEDDNGPDGFADGEEDAHAREQGSSNKFRTYAHGGRLWDTPPYFEFPSEMHAFGHGWTLWIVGLPGYTIRAPDGSTQAAPVRPFRSLHPKLLPGKLKTQYTVNWLPIFKMMEAAPDLNIPNDQSTINAAVIQETLEKAKAHVKTRVSYLFNKTRKANPEVWKVGTWSKYIANSEILKYGTEQDKAQLPAPTKRNKPRQNRMSRKRKTSDNNRVRRRVQRQENNQEPAPVPPARQPAPVPPARQPDNNNQPDLRNQRRATIDDSNSDAFAEAFAGAVVLTEATQRRDADLQEDANAQIYADSEDARAERNPVGDGVGTDGSRLFVVQKKSARKIQIVKDRYGRTKKIGHCCVSGCSFPQMELNHHCYAINCRKEVHNMCCGSQQLYDDDNELNMYCSPTCKSRGRN
jgi:hypothetical protein